MIWCECTSQSILRRKTSKFVGSPECHDDDVKMNSLTILIAFYVIFLIAPTNQRIIVGDKSAAIGTRNSATDGGADVSQKSQSNEVTKSVTYIRASTPARVLECVSKFTVLRCMKLFVLQKMEGHKTYPRSGNLTKDFLDQFFGDDKVDMGSLVEGELAQISDTELTQRVIWNFKRFFKNRDIQLHFLPGIMVRIVPSKENKIKLSLKKTKRRDLDEVVSGRGKGEPKKKTRKKKKDQSYKSTMIQMAVPIMVMPAVLLGTFLPFILPALKMATIMSTVLNNSAFLAALLYAARTHVLNSDNEAQPVSYNHGTFH